MNKPKTSPPLPTTITGWVNLLAMLDALPEGPAKDAALNTWATEWVAWLETP